MAGTIAIGASVRVTNGGFSNEFVPTSLALVQTGQGVHDTVVTVTTSESDMPIGLIATEGWLVIRNLDPTNFVRWGPKSAGVMVPVGILKPATDGKGCFAIFEMDPAATIRWIADTGSCKVLMKLFEA